MNNRRKLVIALGAGAFVAPLGSFAQQPGKPVRVGILSNTTAANYQVRESSFVDAMRELGWVEGRNIVYDRVYADDDEARLPALAAALVASNPDVIHASPTDSAVAAFNKTRTIPIVFGGASDVVEIGMVKSLAHPGGNVTGIANIGWELGGKRLQLLKQAMPRIIRVGVLVNPLVPSTLREQKLIEQAGEKLGVKVTSSPMQQVNEVDAAFAPLVQRRIEAVLTTNYTLFINARKRILELAAKQRIPVVGHRSEYAADGALLSYGALLSDQFRSSARLVDKILKGTKPADIPVEQPTKFELAVNIETAKSLGITIPSEIMLQATKVID
jgi:putative tryptophan/tyrosine transport system substrate-binding protein